MQRNAAWIDISVPITPHMALWPGDPEVRTERIADLNRGDEATVTRLELGVHAGTHVDAPSHFLAQGATLDELSPELLIGDARVILIRNPERVTVADLQAHEPQPGERLLLKTRNGNLRERQGFCPDFVGLDEAAAHYLADARIAVLGIDYLSIAGYQQDQGAVHRCLLGGGIWLIENLDLSAVQPGPYELVCLPLRISGAEAAPARALVRPKADNLAQRQAPAL